MGAVDPREVAGGLVDTEHRLPGERESESSPLLEDAEHWLQVYAELANLQRTLLGTAKIEQDAPEPVVEKVSSDRLLFRPDLERLSQRHSFWLERVSQLQRG